MNNDIVILGIESSCDDTSAAILRVSKVLSNIVANQSIHEKFGGVVPELASRAHQQNIVPVIDTAIKEANITKSDIDLIAYTKGPGLLGSLLVGSSFAKSLSLALDKPLVSVNHMQAHILAHFIEHEDQKKPEFPFLCLTVSGGHTQIVKVNSYNEMKVIGNNRKQTIFFMTNVGEQFEVKERNPITIEFNKPECVPFVHIRNGLKAGICRSVYYRFAELIVSEEEEFGFWSAGSFQTIRHS